jgi:hypothetical protein
MMAVEGIGNLAQILANQLREQSANSQSGANLPATANAGNVPITEDTFTPSTQNNSAQSSAQEAGIFQLNQGTLSSIAANQEFYQATANAQNIGTPAQVAASAPQQAAPANSNAPAHPGPLFTPKPPGQTTAARAPSSNVQVQIQALNAALPALGLSKVEIQEIDSLAQQIQNFNPATYTDLINQFKALEQQSTQQGAPSPAVNASTIGTQNTTSNTKGNGSGSQT